MAFTNQTLKSGPYDCNGSVVDFAGTFYCIDPDDITVTYTDTGGNEQALVAGVGYTMTTATADFPTSSFSIQTTETYATGEKITISRNTPLTQETSYGNSGPYLPKVHENSFDKSMVAIQELFEIISRCVQFPISEDPGQYTIIIDEGDTVIYTQLQDGAVTTVKLADKAVTLAKMADLAQDTIIGRKTASTGVPEAIACTAAGRALIDDADASAQRTTLGLGTMSTQNANSVAITGGTITGITLSGQSMLSTNNLYHIEDRKSDGVGGGNSTGATWNDRVLNTEVTSNISGASLASNVITLPAGTYWIEFDCPAYESGSALTHQSRLYNVDDTATEILGSSGSINNVSGTGQQAWSHGAGLVVLDAEEDLKLQTYTSGSETNGLGSPASTGAGEVYSSIKIWKVA